MQSFRVILLVYWRPLNPIPIFLDRAWQIGKPGFRLLRTCPILLVGTPSPLGRCFCLVLLRLRNVDRRRWRRGLGGKLERASHDDATGTLPTGRRTLLRGPGFLTDTKVSIVLASRPRRGGLGVIALRDRLCGPSFRSRFFFACSRSE
jgi:hypothetical protein